jgi:hypothetical protein
LYPKTIFNGGAARQNFFFAIQPKIELPNQHRIRKQGQKIDQSLEPIVIFSLRKPTQHEKESNGQG